MLVLAIAALAAGFSGPFDGRALAENTGVQAATQGITSPATGAVPAGEAAAETAPEVRIKDIARLKDVRDNQLIGLGLVVGLNGTGDGSSSMANVQMVANMLGNLGLVIPPNQLRVRNVAAVTVTANLGPFNKNGDRLDVTVSSFGDAKSLQGGTLLMTPLKGADGETYAVVQGAVLVGGYSASGGGGGGGGASAQKNHPTVGTIPSGAIVEKEVQTTFVHDGSLTLVLSQPDFTTAARLAQTVNKVFTANTARAVDEASVTIAIPPSYKDDPIGFIATVEELPVRPDAVAKVVVNERTGTVVIGANVRISTVAVAHGNLSVRVDSAQNVSQPPPLSQGETKVTQQTKVDVKEKAASLILMPAASSVNDLVRALNAIGASPRDIITILQAIKEAGALHGELVVM